MLYFLNIDLKSKRFCLTHLAVMIALILAAPIQNAFAGTYTCEQLFQSESFTQSVLHIQKDLMGNRPLIAMIRTSKKSPEIENALVEIINIMPASFRESFSENTGYEIKDSKLVLKKEMKISRKWETEFTKKMLELVNSGSIGGVLPPVIWTGYSMSGSELNTALSAIAATAIDGLLKADKLSLPRNRESTNEIMKMVSTRDAEFYFLLENKLLVDRKRSEIYKTTSDLSPEMAAESYNGSDTSAVAVTAAEIVQGRVNFINQIASYTMHIKQIIESTPHEEVVPSKLGSEVEAKHTQRSTSLHELIESMTASDAAVVSQHLAELIRSVDSSERQQKQIEQALIGVAPQVALLKISYELKQKRELTQREIQTAIFIGLDEVTKVAPQEIHSLPTQQLLSAHAAYVHEHSQETTAADVLAARGSKARIEHIKNLLLKKNSNSSNEPFNLVVQNEKEFFEVFKPGTNGFNRLESDLDALNQKLARVYKYFSDHTNQNMLAGDGHFSIAYKNIFSLRFGEYRLLLTVEKTGETPQLVILCVYNKSDEGGNFYELAESRRLHRQP